MPKDEFDFEDPLELNGMAFMTHEDTTTEMAETFIEEFMRMGHGHRQILALFQNPHYLGPNLALQKRGEPFIRDLITEIFARWGRAVAWPEETKSTNDNHQSLVTSAATVEHDSTLTDPTGAPIPKLNI
jgi:hypothetical protein